MNTPWDILGVGNAAVDELILLDSFPQPDTKVEVRGAQRQGGGLTATALVAAARLGAKTAFCSLIGEDELSAYTLAEMEREGVDCSPCLVRPDGKPFHAWILVDQKGRTRTILYEPGRVEPPPEHITEEMVAKTRVLFIDHHVPKAGLHAARLARERGVPVVADVEHEHMPGLSEFLAEVDHLIVGLGFAGQVTGQHDPAEMARALGGPERACAVVTAGERGCWYVERGGPAVHYPAFQVDVTDTTGCGDVFHGAYAGEISRGESAARAVAVATAAAGLKAAHPGGRAGIPDRAAVARLLEERDGRA